MIPELGQFALITALLIAVCQFALPMLGAWRGNAALMAVARPAAFAQLAFVALAFGLLAQAFVSQDFSVAYVAQNSNSKLPVAYRYSAVWGAHEGSLLLWILILSIWTAAVAALSRALPQIFMSRVLGTLGFVSAGFLLFTLVTSNPFLRHLPGLVEGNDLNPLLQDPGMIMHPPMLYVGYVGFSVAFAFAIAALLGGTVDARWVRWSRPWTNVAWAFLTLGIALGSWWAYYELGWGGWWFWDPVENASFMPWLVGAALIHSQAVTEKRGSFRAWTLLLAIFAFSLSLLGTFLVRSGVLTSVHAFASDPERGLFILAFLGIVVGGSLLLFALRGPRVSGGEPFAAVSRETMLLVNNLLLATAAAMVLLGTLYPLIVDAFGGGKISVGPPYFGLMFLLLMIPAILVMPFGPLLRWRGDALGPVWRALRPALALAIVAAGAAWLLGPDLPLKALAGIAGAFWLLGGTGVFLLRRWRSQPAGHRYTPEMLGMALAHIGVGLFIAGVMLTESTSVEKDLRMMPGERVTLRDLDFRFDGVRRVEGPNFIADTGTISVMRGEQILATLEPEKRQYMGRQIMTEADIDPGLTRDLYVALGEPLGDTGAWAVRIYYKPFIRFIWLGALLMMFGGFIVAGDRRFRVDTSVREAASAAKELAAGARA